MFFFRLRIITLASAALLGAASAIASTEADGCAPIRLDHSMIINGKWVDGSMAFVAVRDQLQIGSCYAHSAAQMFDAWRFKQGDHSSGETKHFSSGFEIGQRFKIDEREFDIDGGKVAKILPVLRRQGSCSQQELNGLFRGISVDQYATAVMRIFHYYKKEFATQTQGLDAKSPKALVIRNALLERGIEELKSYHSRVLTNPDMRIQYERLFKSEAFNFKQEFSTVKMFEIISIIGCDSERRIHSRGGFRVQNSRTHIRNWLTGGETFQTDRALKILNRTFDRGLNNTYPVGVGYCSAVLAHGRKYAPLPWESNECKRHSSVVIGRRRDPKTQACQFLVRNSWGKKCNYNSDWTCEAERGSVWIDADTLASAIHNLQVMKPLSR